MKETVLITGASAGIGRATAIYLAEHGYNVYGAARRVEKMADLTTYGIRPLHWMLPWIIVWRLVLNQLYKSLAALTSW